jgi:hypothetical protein
MEQQVASQYSIQREDVDFYEIGMSKYMQLLGGGGVMIITKAEWKAIKANKN